MKRRAVASLVVVALAFDPVVSALAQQGGSGSGGGMKGRSQWMYDPSKSEMESGESSGAKILSPGTAGARPFPLVKTFARALPNKNLDSFSPCF